MGLVKKCSFCLLTVLLFNSYCGGQDSSFSIAAGHQPEIIKPYSIFVPAGVAVLGGLTFRSKAVVDLNHSVQDAVTPDDKTRKFHADDYLQYAPALMVFGLNNFGVKGTHRLGNAAIIFGMSNIILNSIVVPAKHFSHELRPDSSEYSSFPSGHTAEAFASAEFLRMEYKDQSPWYGVAGYGMAIATGYLRMYNNKHWLSDVLTGACIGIVSTRASYWIFSKIEKRKAAKRKPLPGL